MRSKWHASYEMVRYTPYSFFNFDRNSGTIWLKNQKDRSIMCINDFTLTENEMERMTGELFDNRYQINAQAGFEVASIQLIYMTGEKVEVQSKENGMKVLHRGIEDLKNVIRNPFFRLDMEYKNPKDDAYYQRRLMGPHPFEKYMIKFTPVTYLLICINLIVFLFNYIAINFYDSYILTNGLALSHFDVMAGDVYRLLTSSFLHMTIDHFIFNIFALYILGKFMESLYGKLLLLTAYLAAGILSSMFSMMFMTEGVSLGASGAVYGLLGIIIVHLLINRRINLKLVLQIAVIFIVISVLSGLFANINHYAHIGGLIFGALLGVLYNPRKFGTKWILGAGVTFVILTGISYFIMSSQESRQPFDEMALEHIDDGEYEEALSVLNEALRSENDTSMTYYGLGLLSEISGNQEQADKFHSRSYDMDPENELVAKQRLIELRKERNYEAMGGILDNFDTSNIEDEGLKLLAEEYYNGE